MSERIVRKRRISGSWRRSRESGISDKDQDLESGDSQLPDKNSVALGQPGWSADSWKLLPFLVGLALAPILFACVLPLQQAIVGSLFGLCALLLIFDPRHTAPQNRSISVGWWIVGLGGLILPLVPLPAALVGFLSPERLALAQRFPLWTGEQVGFLTLTIAPADTIQRVWEVWLVVVCFSLSRHAARMNTDRAFVTTLSTALLTLAGSDIWYRLNGRVKLLGIWPGYSSQSAGTFANRDHFADWIFVAALFVLGSMVQRTTRPPGPAEHSNRVFSWFGAEMAYSALAVGGGVYMGLLTGSRGAFLALCIGGLFFLVFTAIRLGSRGISPRVLILTLVASVVILYFGGGYVLGRFASGDSIAYKASIWHVAWQISRKFPIFGSGLGSFETSFYIFRTFGASATFVAAENDYVQTLSENGLLIGGLAVGLVLISLAGIFRFAWSLSRRTPDPLLIGALSALVVFLVHCCVEFVFQITATALLASALFGWLYGVRDRVDKPVLVPPPSRRRVIVNLVWALVLLCACGSQFSAWGHRRAALEAASKNQAARQFADSLRLSPGDPFRVDAFQSVVEQDLSQSLRPGATSEFDSEIQRMLYLDPLNWRIRWAAFPLVTYRSPGEATNEAWRIIRLDQTDPYPPLYFARHFAGAGVTTDLPFLIAAADFPENLKAVYNLAWNLSPGGGLLWKVTPNTDKASQALGDFALSKSLWPMAAEAFKHISEVVSAEDRAENYLNAHRPDWALKLLSGASPQERLLRARACFQLGEYVEAVHAAESVWENSSVELELTRAPSVSDPRKMDDALIAVEKIFHESAEKRDLPELRRLANSSGNLRVQWMVFETERERGQFEVAAKTGIKLASQVLQRSRSP